MAQAVINTKSGDLQYGENTLLPPVVEGNEHTGTINFISITLRTPLLERGALRFLSASRRIEMTDFSVI